MTVFDEDIETVQVLPETLVQPDQPENVEPEAAAAVRVTVVPEV